MTSHPAESIQPHLNQLRAAAEQSGEPQTWTGAVAWHSPRADQTLATEVHYQVGGPGQALTATVNGQPLDLAEPVRLVPVRIAKPWGQEIWFTGMEARGESAVQAAAQTLPLPLYLALAPDWLHGAQPIVLLKILDPSSQPVLGDLYFEVHEQKEETYVVTQVDPEAWPDGVGAIRYGVNQNLRASYVDDVAFRAAYLDAVQAYERVRRVLDQEQEPSDADPELAQASARNAELVALERSRRAAMERFTETMPLRVGDIVSVPPWHPHALQHGVQVVEFQSPTFERYIISFAQQVQTQGHWDSATAIARMSLEPIKDPVADPSLPAGVSRIARYRDFGALRVKLDNNSYALPKAMPYLIVTCIEGTVTCGPLTLQPGEAAFVPHLALGKALALQTPGNAALALLAAPGL